MTIFERNSLIICFISLFFVTTYWVFCAKSDIGADRAAREYLAPSPFQAQLSLESRASPQAPAPSDETGICRWTNGCWRRQPKAGSDRAVIDNPVPAANASIEYRQTIGREIGYVAREDNPARQHGRGDQAASHWLWLPRPNWPIVALLLVSLVVS